MTDAPNNFTTRDILGMLGKQLDGIDAKIDRLSTRLELKADSLVVAANEAKLEELQKLTWKHEEVQRQYIPQFVELVKDMSAHLQSPHAVAGRWEERIVALERWRWMVSGGALIVGFIAGIIARFIPIR